MELQDVRRDYRKGTLTRDELLDNPIEQFKLWMQQALTTDLSDPTAMVLGTSARDGQVSQRVVLLKGLDERGFVFFTNYESRKSREIAVNSKVSLHFPWFAIERQVMIAGVAEKVSVDESRAYFQSRPRDSQLAAWASPQSRVVKSREVMTQQLDTLSKKYAESEIPLPEFWGGFRVRPSEIEFWQGGPNRLHDRFIYSLQPGGHWLVERLAP
ncbi:MAG: pyridoxamine 5'-phosphate oxidase [Pseudohongiella sp.]|nr:pyridoxamine 5'-phosphate oxidase [Pseudohongiella sp.]MDO9520406.1 pyridoxamine 5'-phosphate oxidase [Pseudohongiella sp.]MDP2126585.1 pyridoxamine 5'-phosphate oxidase [Pseudohongiella sp.]